MRVLAALGGNALLERGDKPDAAIQLHHIQRAARALAPIAAAHELIICHGNGPQVGLLALESAADPLLTVPYPLDCLGAQTQGMIGYWLAQSLHNAGINRPIVALITQTVVDPADPAFSTPTKFVGPTYTAEQAHHLAEQRHWQTARDGNSWRRVVPSPRPRQIVEATAIAHLLSAGHLIICGGGGGAPVIRGADGNLTGVEAVVDKDLTAAHLAVALHADRLLLLTDVDAVIRDYGTPHATPINRTDPQELATMRFPTGSMGPKIEAVSQFVTATATVAAIGHLEQAADILAGTAGTTITHA